MKTETYYNWHSLTDDQREYMRNKRVLDAILALAALLLLLIPISIIAAARKWTEPGEPVFFSQERYGQGGQVFSVLKFRSMKSSCGDEKGRMTSFGRFLRDTSLDELPQLIQVVQGKMSLVGPRPLDVREKEIHALRAKSGIYQLRPGLTGWAQIHGRDRLSVEEKVFYDRQYLEKMCFAMDVKILWQTVKMLLKPRRGDTL